MAKGGYKGSSPARETSPEEYSGVWDITEQYGEQKAGSWPFQADDCAPKGLRFNGSSGYLSKTFAAAGDRRTWSVSFWVKGLGNGVVNRPFFTYGAGNDATYVDCWFNGTGGFNLSTWSVYYIQTAHKFRDPSAWYHFLIHWDSNNSDAGERCRLYVNGVKQTRGGSNPSSAQELGFLNSGQKHTIGAGQNSQEQPSGYSSFTLAEYHLIDGQNIPPEEFGFIDGQGIWQPKRFTGDYANGQFYADTLTGVDGSTVSNPQRAFDGDLTTSSNTTGGTKFTPKGGSQSNVTSLRFYSKSFGQGGTIKLNGTTIESNYDFGQGGWYAFSSTALSNISNTLTSFEWDRQPGSGSNNYDYIYAIEINGEILREGTVGRNSARLDFSDGVKDQSGQFNDWTGNGVSVLSGSPESRIWESGDSGWTIASDGSGATEGGGNGYQDVFTGLMEAGKVYAFTTSHTNGDQNGGWFFADSNSTSLSGTHPNQGRGTNSIGQRGRSSGHSDEDKAGAHGTFATANGVTAGDSNLSGFTTINPEGADTINWVVDRVKHKVWVKRSSDSAYIQGGNPSDGDSAPSFHLPSTGDLYFGFVQYNNTNFTISIASYSVTADRSDDLLVDSPVNGNEPSTAAGGQRRGNYCSLNPLDSPGCTLSNGNLNISCGSSKNGRGTVWPSSGKWYFEFDITTYGNPYVGIGSHGGNGHYVSKNSIAINNTGSVYVSIDGNQTYPGYSIRLNAIGSYMCAFDLDNGKIWWGKDGTWYETTTSANNSIALSTVEAGNGAYDFSGHPNFGKEWTVQFGTSSNTSAYAFNAGQRAFKYPSSVPSGFSPLATSFLPKPTIKRGDDAMAAVVYSGNNTNNKIKLKFSPDILWLKSTTSTQYGAIASVVQGANYFNPPNQTGQQKGPGYNDDIKSFDDDGFTLGSDTYYAAVNRSPNTYSAFAWDAGDTTTTIAAGGLNSSAYNQSVTWSNLVTGTLDTQYGNSSATAPFDGDTGSSYSDGIRPTSGNYLSMNFGTTFANATSVKIYGHASLDGVTYAGANENLKINGTAIGASDWANNGGGSGQSSATFTLSNGLTSLEWGYSSGSQSTGYLYLQGIEVDGTLLADPGGTVTNNVPTLATTVRANPSTGCSAIKYSGGSDVATVAHGLNKEPHFAFFKKIQGGEEWGVYHRSLGNAASLRFKVNSAGTSLWQSKDPTSFVMPLSYQGAVNESGGDYLGFLWTSIEGFSSFGSFEGTDLDPGPFVYLGFRPKLIFLKNADASQDWVIYDTTRSTSNEAFEHMHIQDTAAQNSTANDNSIDILSNGFIPRAAQSTNDAINGPSNTIIYCAWAENPFASNARAR